MNEGVTYKNSESNRNVIEIYKKEHKAGVSAAIIEVVADNNNDDTAENLGKSLFVTEEDHAKLPFLTRMASNLGLRHEQNTLGDTSHLKLKIHTEHHNGVNPLFINTVYRYILGYKDQQVNEEGVFGYFFQQRIRTTVESHKHLIAILIARWIDKYYESGDVKYLHAILRFHKDLVADKTLLSSNQNRKTHESLSMILVNVSNLVEHEIAARKKQAEDAQLTTVLDVNCYCRSASINFAGLMH